MKKKQTISASINVVNSIDDLIQLPFQDQNNALCWERKLQGDFAEIVSKLTLRENITEISVEELQKLSLTATGQQAREIILEDMKLLSEIGALPVLNLLKNYERDTWLDYIPTDVYSFHADSSPVPVHTYLCTYFGAPSEILPNEYAIKKADIPAVRKKLEKLASEFNTDLETFLSENCFDLHYEAQDNAPIRSMGLGNLWRIAVQHPEQSVLPCIHRAPVEKGLRLMLIC